MRKTVQILPKSFLYTSSKSTEAAGIAWGENVEQSVHVTSYSQIYILRIIPPLRFCLAKVLPRCSYA